MTTDILMNFQSDIYNRTLTLVKIHGVDAVKKDLPLVISSINKSSLSNELKNLMINVLEIETSKVFAIYDMRTNV